MLRRQVDQVSISSTETQRVMHPGGTEADSWLARHIFHRFVAPFSPSAIQTLDTVRFTTAPKSDTKSHSYPGRHHKSFNLPNESAL